MKKAPKLYNAPEGKTTINVFNLEGGGFLLLHDDGLNTVASAVSYSDIDDHLELLKEGMDGNKDDYCIIKHAGLYRVEDVWNVLEDED